MATRAFADDAAMVVPDFRAQAASIVLLYRDCEQVAGLTFNTTRAVLLPLCCYSLQQAQSDGIPPGWKDMKWVSAAATSATRPALANRTPRGKWLYQIRRRSARMGLDKLGVQHTIHYHL